MGEEHVPVGLEFTVEDHASDPLEKLAAGAESLAEHVNHIGEALTDVIGLAGVLGGAFSFAKLVEGTIEHVGAVGRLATQTGIASEEADGLLESFNKFGISADGATNIVGRMSRQMLQLNKASTGVSGTAGIIYQEFHRLGVDLRQGIVPSILHLSERVKEGKIHAQDLARGMHLSTDSALQFAKFLKQGPESIRETIEELRKSGSAVTAEDLARVGAFKAAKADLSSAFERVTFVVGRELMPVVTELMRSVADNAKEWVESAKEFGHWLNDNLRTAVSVATTLGKILLANAILQRVGAGGIAGIVKPIAKNINDIASGYQVGASLMGAGELASAAAGIAAGAVALTGVAAAIALVVEGAQSLATNYKGVADRQSEASSYLSAAWESLTSNLAASWDNLFGHGSATGFLDFFRTLLPDILTGLTTLATGLLATIEAIGLYLHGALGTGKYRSFADVNAQVYADMEKRKQQTDWDAESHRLARVNAENRAAGKADTNMDFRGSHFTIDQQFAEGYEPDRILTAFTHDLAGLGERGGQSPFAPNAAVGRAGG